MKDYFNILIPIILQDILLATISITDNVMVGGFGESMVTAIGIAATIQLVMASIYTSLRVGFITMANERLARNDINAVNRITGILTSSVTIVSIIFGLSCYYLTPYIGTLFTQNQEVLEQLIIYNKITAYFHAFGCIRYTTMWWLQLKGHTRLVTLILVPSVVVNVIVNYICLYPLDMGIAGAAYGTLISTAFSTGVSIYLHKSAKVGFCLSDVINLKTFVPQLREVSHYIKFTLNVISTSLMSSIILVLSGLTYRNHMLYEIAALQIVIVIFKYIGNMIKGMAIATTIYISPKYSTYTPKDLQAETDKVLKLNIVIYLVLATILFLVKPIFLDFYKVSEDTINLAYKLFNIHLVIHIFICVSEIISSLFNITGHLKFKTKVYMLLYIFVQSPILLYLSQYSADMMLVAVLINLTCIVACVPLTLKYIKNKKMSI